MTQLLWRAWKQGVFSFSDFERRRGSQAYETENLFRGRDTQGNRTARDAVQVPKIACVTVSRQSSDWPAQFLFLTVPPIIPNLLQMSITAAITAYLAFVGLVLSLFLLANRRRNEDDHHTFEE